MQKNLIKSGESPRFNRLVAVVRLLRPQQWLKNFFVFLPLFFSRHFFDVAFMGNAILAFCSFCLMASAVYCFNDIWDVKADRLHPLKRRRPIASGVLSVHKGYLCMVSCVAASVFTILFIPDEKVVLSLITVMGYFVMNLAYCVRLKHYAILDVFIISIGFVMRVLLGGFATGIFLSHWIILMTFLLALFLAFAKRRDDIVLYENTGTQVRKNVNRYNLTFMNQAITIVSSLTMVCYLMYTVSPEVMSLFGSRYVFLTSVFVLAGIIKYLQITIVDVKSGSPTKVLMTNRFIQLCIAGWVVSFIIILYL